MENIEKKTGISKYLHSHMLQEDIVSVIESYKSCIALKKKY